MSGVRSVHQVETGLNTSAKLIEAWVQDFPDDPKVVILTGAAIRVERIPDLVAMLQKIHRMETDPDSKT